jgi:hypothetical protein
VKNSERAFNALNSSADPDLVTAWEEQEAVALRERNKNPESMDIYDIKVQKGLER